MDKTEQYEIGNWVSDWYFELTDENELETRFPNNPHLIAELHSALLSYVIFGFMCGDMDEKDLIEIVSRKYINVREVFLEMKKKKS